MVYSVTVEVCAEIAKVEQAGIVLHWNYGQRQVPSGANQASKEHYQLMLPVDPLISVESGGYKTFGLCHSQL